MATILFSWELGGGLGHVMRFLPLARKLVARGHRVIAALRELRRAEDAFCGVDIEYLPAPHLAWKTSNSIEPVLTYADLLHNVGFGRIDDLRTLTRSWRTLIRLAKPDLVLCDHSPSAILAASLDGLPCANLGTGFCCPPVEPDLPCLRPWLQADEMGTPSANGGATPPFHGATGETKPSVAEQVLRNINELRDAAAKPRWERLPELYSSVAATFLTTSPELDHFPGRGAAQYLGVWEADQGKPFTWPSGAGPRVFVYTHRFAAQDWLLEHLLRRSVPTVVYTHDYSPEMAKRFAGPTMLMSGAPLKIHQAAPECDIAILNAGHNSAAQFLLAGKPLLLLPLTLEQGLLMRRLTQQGLAVSAPSDRPAAIQAALDDLLIKGRCQAAARAFAAKYCAYSAEAAQNAIVDRIENLISEYA